MTEKIILSMVQVETKKIRVEVASNDLLGLKISYMNDITNLCELVRANI